MVLNKPLEVKIQSFSMTLLHIMCCMYPQIEIEFVSLGPIIHIEVINTLTSNKIMYPLDFIAIKLFKSFADNLILDIKLFFLYNVSIKF